MVVIADRNRLILCTEIPLFVLNRIACLWFQMLQLIGVITDVSQVSDVASGTLIFFLLVFFMPVCIALVWVNSSNNKWIVLNVDANPGHKLLMVDSM